MGVIGRAAAQRGIPHGYGRRLVPGAAHGPGMLASAARIACWHDRRPDRDRIPRSPDTLVIGHGKNIYNMKKITFNHNFTIYIYF